MEARKTCFISFIKLLFSLLTKRKTIYEARIVNSHNSETINHIAHAIFVLHSVMKHTCRPIKTHLLSKLFYNIASNSRTQVPKTNIGNGNSAMLVGCSYKLKVNSSIGSTNVLVANFKPLYWTLWPRCESFEPCSL